MASGFQQDKNQLIPTYYRVTIDMTGYSSASTTAGGAVTPNSSDSFSIANLPTTTAKGVSRARGNQRFRNVLNRLGTYHNVQILDVTVTGETNGDAQATNLAFTVGYERDAFIPSSGSDIQSGAITTKAGFIQDLIVRGILDATTESTRVYDDEGGYQDQQINVTVAAPDSVADVASSVSVTLIDTLTLINA